MASICCNYWSSTALYIQRLRIERVSLKTFCKIVGMYIKGLLLHSDNCILVFILTVSKLISNVLLCYVSATGNNIEQIQCIMNQYFLIYSILSHPFTTCINIWHLHQRTIFRVFLFTAMVQCICNHNLKYELFPHAWNDSSNNIKHMYCTLIQCKHTQPNI